jgi:LL-diaminopimelate aminotransferase
MTGWRIGWVRGNKHQIDVHGNVKAKTDSGQFLPLRKAAAHALSNVSIPDINAARYSERMDSVTVITENHGFKLDQPKVGFFLYELIPTNAELTGQIPNFTQLSNLRHG